MQKPHIVFLNGRGQLGEELQTKIYYDGDEDIHIYHTWNIDDKSEFAQRKEFEKFKEYVIQNKNNHIIFISTLHTEYGEYLKYKIKAELYLWENTDNGQVIRLPYMIGKGLCKKIRDDDYKPYKGNVVINTFSEVVKNIYDCILYKKRLVIADYHIIDSGLLYELVKYGVKND